MIRSLTLLLLGLAIASQPLVAQSPTLRLHLPFDGNAQDATGQHAPAQVVGAQLAPDRFNTPDAAYYFDGVDDYIHVDTLDLASAPPWEVLTITCWFKLDRLKTGFLLASNTACVYQDDDFLNLALTYDGNYQDFFAQLMGRTPRNFMPDTEALDREWHHLAFVYDRGETRLYFDGRLADTQQTPFPATDYQHQPALGLRIGAATLNLCPFNSHFSGSIDDVRIYGEALTDAQLATLIGNDVAVSPIIFPNAISPNRDSHNDRFKALQLADGAQLQQLAIYNRWGQRIFQQQAEPFAWDGRINGQQAPRDTYIYQAIVQLPNGDTQLISGELLVL